MDKFISIRGATTLKKNDKEEIVKETLTLVSSLIKANDLLCGDISIINCIISSTADIDECYPASAITNSGILENVPLFSVLEPNIKNSLPLCIRIMLTVMSRKELTAKHVYLNEAEKLKTNINKYAK